MRAAYGDAMSTSPQTFRTWARWWPAIIGALGLAVSVPSLGWLFNDSFYGPVFFALAVVAMTLVYGGTAVSVAYPLVAVPALLIGGLLVSTFPYGSAAIHNLVAIPALMLALFGVRERRLQWIALGAVLVDALLLNIAIGGGGATAALFLLIGAVVWGIPFGVRTLIDASKTQTTLTEVSARASVAETELRDQRVRADISRDFHDVLAHSLTVIAAQAEGLRLTHAEHPERVEPVATKIADTARLALVEVRALLERVDDESRRPGPTADDIAGLIDATRGSGREVVFIDAGEHGSLSRAGGTAAYRIVQESLTNAIRHGAAGPLHVSTLWSGPGLSLAVSSPIADAAALAPAGLGISGMHARASSVGGFVTIDASSDRFVVSAFIPYAVEAAPSSTEAIIGADGRVANPMGGPTASATTVDPTPTNPTPIVGAVVQDVPEGRR